MFARAARALLAAAPATLSGVAAVAIGGLLIIAAVTSAACSDSSRASQATDASVETDAASDAPSSDVVGDAGLDVDRDPDVYPSPHGPIPQIDFLGGPVLASIDVVTITFQGDPWRADVEAYDDAIVKGDWWTTSLAEYGVGAGAKGTRVVLADGVSGTSVADEDVPAFLAANVRSGALPAPTSSTVYLLHYPETTDVSFAAGSLTSCVDFIGYHSEASLALEAGATSVAYAVVARCPSLGTDEKRFTMAIAGHVLAEAATDPRPSTAPAYQLATNDAWLAAGGSVAKSEVGDRCGYRLTVDAGGFPAQRLWSNAAAKATRAPCVPSAPGEIWFGAAVRTDLELVGVHKSYGYLVMSRGETRDVVADVFSGAPLPGELSLVVGRDHGATDPKSLDPLPGGITAALSRATAHNGNGVIVRVAVPSTTLPGDYAFVVRAILDAQTFYDWPVIVRAK